MDQNQDNEGGHESSNNGGINGGKKAVKKRNRKSRDCCNCRRGYYLDGDALKQGINDAIANCPPNNEAKLAQLRILQRIDDLRPDGGDLTRRTQAAVLNDLTEVHEAMPSDEAIISLGDRCHNHLWYSALIRRNMIIPADWQGKPHIAIRLEKLRAVWNAVNKTPNLRKRSVRTQVAVNQPAVDGDEGDEGGESIDDGERTDGSEEIEDVEDDENDLDEGLQQSLNAYPTRVPSVSQPQNLAMMPLTGHATNSTRQGYEQMQPEIAYGYQGQSMVGGHPTPQHGYSNMQSPMQPLNQQLLAHDPNYLSQQFVNPNLLSSNNGSVNNFTFSHNQLPVPSEAAYGGSDGALLGPAGSIPSRASAGYDFQHEMPRMNAANHSFGSADSNYIQPVLYGNSQRSYPSFNHANQTSFEARPDALDDNDGSMGMGYDDVYEALLALGLASATDIQWIQALSENGMANEHDMETVSGINPGSSTDGTDEDAGAVYASTFSGDDGSQGE
ncbi:hypothetical protein LY78DRAFT_727999 [Colletotrichum sublineola]|nr:hypothetical protein LY78DRAFT_727999 [Colletotrichum sublineola]